VRFAIERSNYLAAKAERPAQQIAQPTVQRAHAPAHSARVMAGAGVGRGSEFSAGNSAWESNRDDSDNDVGESDAGRDDEPPPRVRPLSVLQVGGNDDYARLLQTSLASTMQVQCDVQRVNKLSDALKCLFEEAYDAIVVEHSLPDSQGVETLEWLQPYAERSPIVMVTKDANEADAIESLQHGAQDCHVKVDTDTDDLARSIRLAMARHQKGAANFDAERAKRSVDKTRQAVEPALKAADRRVHPRYLLTRPLIAIPLLPDGQPVEAFQTEGFTMDVSAEGVGFEIHGLERLPSHRLIVGIEADDGQLYYSTIDVRRSIPIPGGLRIGGKFSKIDRDVLRPENLLPKINHQTHRFDTGLSANILKRWADLGIFQPLLVDRVLVCPDCRAVPTVRRGCCSCGSVRTENSQLIHHFPCAHVGLVTEFEANGEVVCPKCRQRNLIVGADYEYLCGPYHCLDCDWADTELEFVGQCLACDLRFPIQQAVEEELVGYHVHRLDPLALVAKPG